MSIVLYKILKNQEQLARSVNTQFWKPPYFNLAISTQETSLELIKFKEFLDIRAVLENLRFLKPRSALDRPMIVLF